MGIREWSNGRWLVVALIYWAVCFITSLVVAYVVVAVSL